MLRLPGLGPPSLWGILLTMSEGLSGQKSIEFYIIVGTIITAILVAASLYFYALYKTFKTPKVVKP